MKLCQKNPFSVLFKGLFFSLLLMGFTTAAFADQDVTREAKKLEDHFWKLVQKHDTKGLEKTISPIFQGLNVDGPYSKQEQIDGLAGADLESFTLTDFIAHGDKNTIVSTYTFEFVGSGLTPGFNLSIWEKKDNQWHLIGHSYVPFPEPV